MKEYKITHPSLPPAPPPHPHPFQALLPQTHFLLAHEFERHYLSVTKRSSGHHPMPRVVDEAKSPVKKIQKEGEEEPAAGNEDEDAVGWNKPDRVSSQKMAVEQARLQAEGKRARLQAAEEEAHDRYLNGRKRAAKEAAARRASGRLHSLRFGTAVHFDQEIEEIMNALQAEEFTFTDGDLNVVVFGYTGVGKSTFIDWLHGCKLRYMTDEEKSKSGVPIYVDAVCVDECGGIPEVCDIGHGNESKTKFVKKVPIKDTRVVMWDFPGFFDTGGPVNEIIHAAILSKFMSHASVSGMVLMLAADESTLMTVRGQLFNQLIDRIAKLFDKEGGDKMLSSLPSIVFCVTKPQKGTHKDYREIVESAIRTKWRENAIGINRKLKSVVFDPMDKVNSKMTRKEILDFLCDEVTPIKDTVTMNMGLGAEAEQILAKIVKSSIDHIHKLINEENPSSLQISKAFQKFWRISAIQHPIVSEGLEECRQTICAFVRGGLHKIESCCFSLQQDPDDKSKRSKLRKSLQVQQELCKLQGLSQEKTFAKILEDCESRVKDCESDIQKQENFKLDSVFRLHLEHLKRELNDCESDIDIESCKLCTKWGELAHILRSGCDFDRNLLGRSVVITGLSVTLSAKHELNGRTGTALSFDEGRYKVELDETSSSFGMSSSSKECFIKSCNLSATDSTKKKIDQEVIDNLSVFFEDIDRGLEVRKQQDFFLYGDQHDLERKRNTLEGDLLSHSKEIIERAQKKKIEEQNKSILCALNKQCPRVIKEKHTRIGDEIDIFSEKKYMIIILEELLSSKSWDSKTTSRILEEMGFEDNLLAFRTGQRGVSHIKVFMYKRTPVLESMGIIEQWRNIFFVQIIAPCIEECLIQHVLNKFEGSITTNQELQSTLETWDSQGILSDLDMFREKILVGSMSKLYTRALELLERIVKTWIEAQQFLTRIKVKEVAVFEATKHEYKQQLVKRGTTEILEVLLEGKLASEQSRNRLAKALGILKKSDIINYREQIEVIRKHLASMQSDAEVQRCFLEKRDIELTTTCETLSSLKTLLQDHFELDMNPIKKAVIFQYERLRDSVLVELTRKPVEEDFLDYESTRRFGAATIHLKVHTLFPELTQCRADLADAARENLDAQIQTIHASRHASELSSDDVKISTRILVKFWAVSQELGFATEFISSIRSKLLQKLKPGHMYSIGEVLKDMKSDSKDRESSKSASEILTKFGEFVSFSRELFNEKAGMVTFKDALDHPDFKTTGESLDKDALLRVYSHFDKTYHTYVNLMCDRIQAYPKDKVLAKIKKLSEKLTFVRTLLKEKGEDLGELLGLVAAQWSFLTAMSEGVTDLRRKSVKQPHGTQILGILCLLGIGSPKLENRLIQIGTGEGKSVALALTSILLALLGFPVDVVCYSSYLSERDYSDFQKLFQNLEVDSKIHYYSINKLMSKVMKDGTHMPNAREAFWKFLRQESLEVRKSDPSESVLLMDEVDVFFDTDFYGSAYHPSVRLENTFPLIDIVWTNRALLKTSKQVLQLKETKDILNVYPNLNSSLSDGGLSFLECEVNSILDAVSCFPVDGPPNFQGLPEFGHGLDPKTKTSRIFYVDEVSGVPDYDVSYSYLTAFTYMWYIDRGDFKKENLLYSVSVPTQRDWGFLPNFLMGAPAQKTETRNILGLEPTCGTLSYSEVPKNHTYKFGMSGTLNCLTPTQNDILQEFGFSIWTELPSTFKKQKLKRLQTQYCDQEQDDFFDLICESAFRNAEEGRAVLVILEDEKRVNELQKYIKDQGKAMPDDQRPLELTGRLDREMRDDSIRRSTQHRKITFVTRTYGRGTDFICHDARVKKFGGVHLIITFYPTDDSENRQLEGRTCRQDDPGSAEKIIWSEDHKYLGSDKSDFKPASDEEWDDYLRRVRRDFLIKKYENMKMDKEEYFKKHQLTREACRMVAQVGCIQQQKSNIAEKFGEARALPDHIQMQQNKSKIGSTQSVEVCFVMDCTGSMASSIKACKDEVIKIADRIKQEMGEHDRFRMSFVAYRDYCNKNTLEYDPPGKVDVCRFTEDIEQLKAFVSNQNANGGGDGPEDICGGLREATSLDWEGDKRFLFLIADCPCHGSKYHEFNDDNFPDGDPKGLKPEEQFANLMDEEKLKVNCYFIQPSRLTKNTDSMMEVINKHCKEKVSKEVNIQVLDSGCHSYAQDLQNLVTSEVVKNMKRHFR
jgi:hypothetical protein